MMDTEQAAENLFSYGTLQSEAVQLATFGRKLEGRADALVGYKVVMVEIDDTDFVATSGTAKHRSLQFTGVPSDVVEGMVFFLTTKEIELADAYEPAGYARVEVRLRSGTPACVYINNNAR